MTSNRAPAGADWASQPDADGAGQDEDDQEDGRQNSDQPSTIQTSLSPRGVQRSPSLENLVRLCFSTQNKDSLASLDTQMDETIAEIHTLLDTRRKDFQGIEGRKDRMPLLSNDLGLFESYRTLRHRKLHAIVGNLDQPPVLVTSSALAAEKMRHFHRVDVELGDENNGMLERLTAFFGQRAREIIEEWRLVLGRWERFGIMPESPGASPVRRPSTHRGSVTAGEMPGHLRDLRGIQDHLHAEFTDSIDRWERLATELARKKIESEESLKKSEAARADRERRGLLREVVSMLAPSTNVGGERQGITLEVSTILPASKVQPDPLVDDSTYNENLDASASRREDLPAVSGSLARRPSLARGGYIASTNRRPSLIPDECREPTSIGARRGSIMGDAMATPRSQRGSVAQAGSPARRVSVAPPGGLTALGEYDDATGSESGTGSQSDSSRDDDERHGGSGKNFMDHALEKLPDPGYTAADLCIFYRHLCSRYAGAGRRADAWSTRAAHLAKNETVEMLRDVVELERAVGELWGGPKGLLEEDDTQPNRPPYTPPERILGDPHYSGLLSATTPLSSRPVLYTAMLPKKHPSPEAFFAEYGLLLEAEGVKTPINSDGGRALAYEVESKFRTAVEDSARMTDALPYETVWGTPVGGVRGAMKREDHEAKAMSTPTQTKENPLSERLGLAVAAGLVLDPALAGSFLGGAVAANRYPSSIILPPSIDPNTRYLRKADWLPDALLPTPDAAADERAAHLRRLKDVDFELKFEMDLSRAGDPEWIAARVREWVRSWTEKDVATAASKWIQSFVGAKRASKKLIAAVRSKKAAGDEAITGNRGSGQLLEEEPTNDFPEDRETEDSQILSPVPSPPGTAAPAAFQIFDFGQNQVPDPSRPPPSSVLDSKRRRLTEMIAKNDELKEIVEEIGDGEGAEAIAKNIREPTTTILFSEHELMSFGLLRNVRARKLRKLLAAQLNYMRSVERRVAINLRDLQKRQESDPVEGWATRNKLSPLAPAATLANMWRQTHFELPDVPVGGSSTFQPQVFSDDLRTVLPDAIDVKDQMGVRVVYDAALLDMSKLEDELLRIGTVYINNGASTSMYLSSDSKAPRADDYMEDLRRRSFGGSRTAETQHFSYLNPNADRGQLLIELYSLEVDFQFAKLQAIEGLLDAFEHLVSADDVMKVAQMIADVIWERPQFDFQQTYFARSYITSIHLLNLRAKMTVEVLSGCLAERRSWVQGVSGKAPTNQTLHGHPGVDSLSTALRAGLPFLTGADSEEPRLSLHIPSIRISTYEIIPQFAIIIRVFEQAKITQRQLTETHIKVFGIRDRTCDPVVVSIATWKWLLESWHNRHVAPTHTVRSTIGSLVFDGWLENPLLPDALLHEVYDRQNRKEARERSFGVSLANSTPWNDTTFRARARELVRNTMHVLIKRNRLFYVWLETELHRLANEKQLRLMTNDRSQLGTRLIPIKLDSVPELADLDRNGVRKPVQAQDEEGDDWAVDREELSCYTTPNESELPQAFFGLAIGELGNGFTAIDCTSWDGIMALVRPGSEDFLSAALKIQVTEKYNLQASVELHNLLLAEVYSLLILAAKDGSLSSASGEDFTKPPKNDAADDVDYKQFICSLLHRKRTLRALMLSEYSRAMDEVRDHFPSAAGIPSGLFSTAKGKLLDWYHLSMVEAVTENCEKLELAQLALQLRKESASVNFGKLVFRSSRIEKNAHYFNDVEAKEERGPSETQILEVGADMQTGKLAKLFYLPHPSEIVLGLAPLDRSMKHVDDFDKPLFPKSQTFGRSLSIQMYIFDIFRLLCVLGKILQENSRYQATVKIVRLADYVVNLCNSMKKDISYFGSSQGLCDLEKTEKYLQNKWTLLHMEMKAAILSCEFALIAGMAPESARKLRKNFQSHYPFAPRGRKKHSHAAVPSAVDQTQLQPKPLAAVDNLLFSHLNARERGFCEAKIVEIFESLNDLATHSASAHGDGSDAVHRLQISFLTNTARLACLRLEFGRMSVPSWPRMTQADAQGFFRVYRTEILADAVRIYHRVGAKGNANPASLLRESILNPADTESFRLNVVAQAAFNSCQIQALQSDIFQDHTGKVLRQAKASVDRLQDERSGKLFRTMDFINLTSQLSPALNVKISEADFAEKSALISAVVEDMYKGADAWRREVKMSQLANVKIDESKVFSIPKEQLSDIITKHALQLVRHGQRRASEEREFLGGLTARLVDTVRQDEMLVHFMANQKVAFLENYHRDVRLEAHSQSMETADKLHVLSTELEQLKGVRRLDERRIKAKIIDDYDELVNELVLHSHILRNRFMEYKTNTMQEVLDILSETKKEELLHLTENRAMPAVVQKSARALMQTEEALSELREENHELRMTLMKLRSMNMIKEAGLRSMNEKKIRKLTEQAKVSEEKLWATFKETDVRERTLRKQLARAHKDLAAAEAESDNLRKTAREAEQRARTQGGPATPSGVEPAQVRRLQDQLKEKQALVEQLLHERQEHRSVCAVPLDAGRLAAWPTSGSAGRPAPGEGEARSKPSVGRRGLPTPANSFYETGAGSPARIPSARVAIAAPSRVGPTSAKKKRLGSATAPWLSSLGVLDGAGPLESQGQMADGSPGPAGGAAAAEELNSLAVENAQLRRLLERSGVAVPEFLGEVRPATGASGGRKVSSLPKLPLGARRNVMNAELHPSTPTADAQAPDTGASTPSSDTPDPTLQEILAALESTDSLDRKKTASRLTGATSPSKLTRPGTAARPGTARLASMVATEMAKRPGTAVGAKSASRGVGSAGEGGR